MFRSFVLIFAMLLATFAHAAPPVLQPGLWEINLRIEMPGMPAGMGSHKIQQCVRQSDLATPEKTLPQMQDKRCQVKDYQLSGDTARWKIECAGSKDEPAMSGSGEMTYSGGKYSGVSRMTMREPGGQTMNMTQHFSGQRIGDCK